MDINLEFANRIGIDGEKGDTGLQGPKGDKGDTGNSGVAISDEAPTDPNVHVWLKPNGTAPEFATKADLHGKQDILISGENIKTINGISILGNGNISVGDGPGGQGEKGDRGDDGKSAYEVAVDHGYAGTEQQWLSTLKGDKGDTGNSGIALSQTEPVDQNVKIWIKLPLGS